MAGIVAPPAAGVVRFRNDEYNRVLHDAEVEDRLTKGATISNTALSIHRARQRPGYGAAQPYATIRTRRRPHRVPWPPISGAVQVSDANLDRSDETAIAINPNNPNNIVAGAATFDGTQFTSSAYVTFDGGATWKTVTALTNTSEGAGIAFDSHGNCYYVTMQNGFNPCCVVSRDGGLTWGAPAPFGYGDKTAVAARGMVALCGFDRVNTEACAFTLDAGANWTVHDFTDSGLGTAPLVSHDEQCFYILYGALDGNIKIYASTDQGATWTGPNIVVPGNAYQSAIPGTLSYEGGALTCPGTNVGIDGNGTIHLLYIDSSKQLPMYTASTDEGNTWSAPVNVNPERAADAHMWPCLSCNQNGDLQAGSVVYDSSLSKYRILQHIKVAEATGWTTFEADAGAWLAGGPSPSYRIGFGDYFDCDSVPGCGLSVMAWSETPNGQQPWQSWARVSDLCQCQEDHVDALENEIEYLLQAFNAEEIPYPRSRGNIEQFEHYLGELREQLHHAETALRRCRIANPLPSAV